MVEDEELVAGIEDGSGERVVLGRAAGDTGTAWGGMLVCLFLEWVICFSWSTVQETHPGELVFGRIGVGYDRVLMFADRAGEDADCAGTGIFVVFRDVKEVFCYFEAACVMVLDSGLLEEIVGFCLRFDAIFR